MDNNQEIKNIHEFDFDMICDYFSSTLRQGPGGHEQTLQALKAIGNLNGMEKIADIGCGTGSSTLLLAQNTSAKITAIDLFPTFLTKLQNRMKEGVIDPEKVQTQVADMTCLDFKNEEFDVIWSEGAIYNIGFKRGIEEWKKYLKKGGFIAVTDASWLTDERPAEIAEFWHEAYPEIDTIAHNVAKLQAAGYTVVSTFTLPEQCWTTNYYVPQKHAQEVFLNKYAGSDFAQEFIKNQRHEAALYDQYKAYYGYVFYIARKD